VGAGERRVRQPEIDQCRGQSAPPIACWCSADASFDLQRIKGNITLPKLTDAEVKRINDIHKNDEKRHSRLCLQPYNKEDNTASGWSLEKLGWVSRSPVDVVLSS
jgi:hypothetical protein